MSKQFIKFCIIGVINTIVDFTVYLTLTRGTAFWAIHLVTATGISFIVSSTGSYFMNRAWTFADHARTHREQYPKFILVTICGLALSTACFTVLLNVFFLSDVSAKILVIGVVLVWNFTINRLWTFRHAV